MLRKIKRWYYQRKIKTAIKILHNLDETMMRAGFSRHDRKQVWRDFLRNRAPVLDILTRASSTDTAHARSNLTGPSDGGGYMRVGRRAGVS